jgi:hypothetical protein
MCIHVNKLNIIKNSEDSRRVNACSEPRHWTEASDQLHATSALGHVFGSDPVSFGWKQNGYRHFCEALRHFSEAFGHFCEAFGHFCGTFGYFYGAFGHFSR